MEAKPQDISRDKALFRLKFTSIAMIVHSGLLYVDFYTKQVYFMLMTMCLLSILILWLEFKKSKLLQPVSAILMGAVPPMMIIFMPNNLLLIFTMQFVSLNYGFNELKWDHLWILFGSHTLSAIVCYLYVFKMTNDSEFLMIKTFFEDASHIYQLVLCFGFNYIGLIMSSADKYLKMKTQKLTESKLLQLNTELEEANRKLQNANKELQEALQEKENFILRFSHEIRNPLNSLLGNIELCNEQATDNELEQMLKDAKVSGEILLQLLNNVLDTAKVATGRLEVSLGSQNIRSFLERAWVICSEIIRKKRLQGSLSVNMNVPEVLEFDHHRLMQILINTISNAAKFTDKGQVKMHVDFLEGAEIKKEDMLPKYGIFPQSQEVFTTDINGEDFEEKPGSFDSLTLNHKNFHQKRTMCSQANLEIPLFERNFFKNDDRQNNLRKIDVLSKKTLMERINHYQSPKEGYIRFEIVDSGCGISKECLENMFKKFQQANNDSSKRQIGTGLGLWITKEIVEMMKGKIEIYSKPNKGTSIVIMIKSRPAPLPTMSIKYPRLQAPSSQKIFMTPSSVGRVLIVEDIAYNQEINKKFFIKCGIEDITIASNGQEAVEIFLKMGPLYFDLILMDIDMPIMDGKTSVKIIRREEKERGWVPVNIIFLTGFSEAKTQKEVLNEKGEYRANGFYPKPASLETIRRIVKNFVSSNKETHLTEAVKTETPLKKTDTQISTQKTSLPRSDSLVLVVDDDSFNLAMVTKMLKLCKINTLEARNGQEAIQIYEENWKRISCILMDCEMPVLDGLEATQRILAKHNQRAALLGKRMSIYGLTGHVGREYRERCLEVGMKDVLEKPIKIEVLSTLLRDRHLS